MSEAFAQTLVGSHVVIAGGTGGIGFATAKRLARAGAQIMLMYFSNPEKASELVSQLPGKGHDKIQASVTDSESLRVAAEYVAKKWGKVDIVVNSAGMTKPVAHNDLDALDDALIDQIFATNWRGSFATIRAFVPLLRQSSDGLIVNISSIAATTGIGSNIAYCAAKAGLDIMANCLGRVLAPNIRVINISPGVVDTNFVAGRNANFNDKTAQSTPLKRLGTADDIAAAVEACATTLKFTTGSVIQVDGGRHL